jgi:3',5'-cyclic AMP phosphodiesterase CpdA
MAAAGTAAPAAAQNSARRRTLRLAHLTDVHVQPGGRAPAGLARALQTIDALDPKPDFILNGGDAIYDAVARDRHDTAAQWKVWHDVTRAATSLPFLHVLGNHDLWGWRFRDDPAIASDPRYGKRWALEELELERPYYTADHGGWRLVVLDSTHTHPTEDYTGRLDDPQREWLEGVLAETPAATPICIVSHIPILSACAPLYFGVPPDPRQQQLIDTVLVHTDATLLENLFTRHPNVKLALSGHLHMEEAVDYRGVTYLCNGSVCGNWWNEQTPAFRGFMPSVTVIDLFDDATWTTTRHPL